MICRAKTDAGRNYQISKGIGRIQRRRVWRMSEEFRYQKKWERYRLYLHLWLPMVALLAVFYALLFNDVPFISKAALANVTLFLWIVFIIVNLSVMFWKCPRCGRNYFKWWKKINILRDFKCRFCGLKKYERSSLKSRSETFGKRFGF
jgi:DNA-directed RNA polymerase subunit RPC12/RpoP